MSRIPFARPGRVLCCVAALLSMGALGCAPAARGRVRTSTGDVRVTTLNELQRAALQRGARELRCPSQELAIESLGAGGFRVDGCAQTITYTCVRGGGIVCAPSEHTGTAELRGEWSDDDVHRYFAAVHDRVAACLPAEMDALRIELAFTSEGVVRRTGRTPRDARTAGCVDAALGSETLHAMAGAARYVVLEFRRSEIGRMGQPIQPIEAAPAAAAAPARARIAPDAAARAVVDARADAILACVEARAISVQLSWDRTGALDALLRGEGHRASDEPCVRAIVRGLTIPAPGSPGMIAHTLQR